ncbi:MAG: hypothetical protein ABW090_09440 [Sedimenticola sp.]
MKMGVTLIKLPVILRSAFWICLGLHYVSWCNAETASELAALYKEIDRGASISLSGKPIFVSSAVVKDRFAADAYGIVGSAFDDVVEELTVPANWCQFVPLNFNVKACTHQALNDRFSLTFYAGRKFYETPDKAYQLHYDYAITNRSDDYVRIVLSADAGPMGTTNYRIELDAIPVDSDTFLRIHSSYDSSFLSRLATDVYLATLGSDKMGFTVVGNTETGEPIYIGGVKGVVERNAMRYYLALQAYLDTCKLPPDSRFEARIQTWFDLSEVHATQLHELEREEYLESKRMERLNQQKLQQALNGAGG